MSAADTCPQCSGPHTLDQCPRWRAITEAIHREESPGIIADLTARLRYAAQCHIDSLDAYDGDLVPINRTRGTANELRKALAATAPESAPADAPGVALPFAILEDEMAALERFHECATDGEGYDVAKPMMQRLACIGLVRRVTANYYEHTNFGLSVLNGDFTHTAPSQSAEQSDSFAAFEHDCAYHLGLGDFQRNKHDRYTAPDVKIQDLFTLWRAIKGQSSVPLTDDHIRAMDTEIMKAPRGYVFQLARRVEAHILGRSAPIEGEQCKECGNPYQGKSADQVWDAALSEASEMVRSQVGDDHLRHICAGAAFAIESLKRKASPAPAVTESAEASDAERIDFIEKEGYSVSCAWKNTGFCGGNEWRVFIYGSKPLVSFEGHTLRQTIDAALLASSNAAKGASDA